MTALLLTDSPLQVPGSWQLGSWAGWAGHSVAEGRVCCTVGLIATRVPRWNADLVLYCLQPLPPLQHPLLAGQQLLHRAPPRPAAGGQHQVRGAAMRPVGGSPPPTVLSWPFLLFCSRREHRGTRTQLWRALVLEELSPALRDTNFSCVFSDPGQTAQRHLVLAQLWVRNPRDGLPGTGGALLWRGEERVGSVHSSLQLMPTNSPSLRRKLKGTGFRQGRPWPGEE